MAIKATKKQIKELKKLDIPFKETNEGLVLLCDWHSDLNPYHELFVEIRGTLEEIFTLTKETPYDPNFLPNLKRLGYLCTANTKQHPDFLKNLEELEYLDTLYTKQDPQFLRNLKFLKIAFIDFDIQDPNFLINIKHNILRIYKEYLKWD